METGPVNKMSPELEPKLHSSANKVRTRLILATFLIGLVLRFLGLHLPPFDYHAARQTQTLSTIQAYHKDGIDLLHPRVNYAGYPGVFVLELPIFQALIALSFRLLGFHLEIIRIFNIALGLATAWFLY